MKYKAIFIDLDKTLMDKRNHKISKLNMDAILKMNKFSKIVVSTGRSWNFVKNVFDGNYPFKYLIAQNGSQIFKNGKLFKEYNFDTTIGNEIIKFSKYHNLSIKINDEEVFYYKRFIHRIISYFTGFDAKKYLELKSHKQFAKIVIFSISKSKTQKIMTHFNNKYSNKIAMNLTRSKFGIEITSNLGTKGNATLDVLKDLKISKENAIHIGDSMNDATAMISIGNGIAMKNSAKELFKYATYIGPKYKKYGIYKIIEKNEIKKIK